MHGIDNMNINNGIKEPTTHGYKTNLILTSSGYLKMRESLYTQLILRGFHVGMEVFTRYQNQKESPIYKTRMVTQQTMIVVINTSIYLPTTWVT